MAWWDAAPSLTPIAAWDAKRLSATHLLDGIGSNDINLRYTPPIISDFEYTGVGGGSKMMPLTTPITLPTTGVIAALWWPRRANVLVCGPAGKTTDYALHVSAPSSWASNYVSSGGAGGHTYSTDASQGVRYFAAMVLRGTDVIMYVDGRFSPTPAPMNRMMPIFGNVGYNSDDDQHNLDSDEFLNALGVWSGTPTLDDMKALEAACRANLATGVDRTARGLGPAWGRLVGAVPDAPKGYMPTRVTNFTGGLGQVHADTRRAGKGYVRGAVTIYPGQLVARKVRLYNETSRQPPKETWSDAITGQYSFDWVDENSKYSVVAYDYMQVHEAVIASNVTPGLMP